MKLLKNICTKVSKANIRREIIRTEINETENRKTMEKINKTKRWFFEKKINEIDNPLTR